MSQDFPKIHLCAFADSRMKNARLRLERQANRSGFFLSHMIGDQQLFTPEFVEKYSQHLNEATRGYGYWVWKPFIIRQALAGLEEHEFLVYMDAGCHLNTGGRQRLQEYCEQLAASKAPVLAFHLGHHHPESRWTKGDVFDFFNARDNVEITSTPQIQSGIIIFKKSALAESFLNEWERVFAQAFHLVDDSPSVSSNLPDFKEHRHDQSIFSLLCKTHGCVKIAAGETYVNDGKWQRLANYPFWVKRDHGNHPSNLTLLLRYLWKRLAVK